jgi:hypothetical protein
MAPLLRSCFGAIISGRWWLAMVLALGLSGCKEWQTHDDGLRDNGLSQTARSARTANKDKDKSKDKDAGCLGLSEESRQVERDLMGQ